MDRSISYTLDSSQNPTPLPSPRIGSGPVSDVANSRRSSRHSLYTKDADPILSHRLRHDSSILAIALTSDRIYAGTQGGEILVFDLDCLERIAVIHGHSASVLALCSFEQHGLLCSSAGDRFVNIWNTDTFERIHCLYSSFDIGDLFCVAYSTAHRTLYVGAQNTSIQWFELQDADGLVDLPKQHAHKFFDGAQKHAIVREQPRHARGGKSIEISKSNIQQYAHNGYVYCLLVATNLAVQASNDEVLISGGGDGIIKVWDLDRRNGGAVRELFALDDGREEDYSVLSMTIDGNFLYAGRIGGQVNVWDLETRQLVRSLQTCDSDVVSLCDGQGFLFDSSASGHVAIYDRQHRLVSRLQAHQGSILSSAVTRRGDRALLVTGGNDNTIAIWDFTQNVGDIRAPQKNTTNEQLLDTLKQFVAFKTVSSDPYYVADCRKGASYLRSVFKRFGAQTEMLATENAYNPVILAKFKGSPATAKKRKAILFYGHYDVVPAENANGAWATDPFSLAGMDGHLYGRGISDNKGPIMAAIFACAELLADQVLETDVVFLIEGEEECGSRGFESTVRKHKDLIGEIDWILLANSYWLDNRIPCLTYGLRGLIHATVQVESSNPDLHSGVDGSSQLDEPLKDLVMLLSTLTGLHGQVRIPGFYDAIPALNREEKQLYHDIVTTLLSRNPDLGDPEELALSLVRRWREASLTIHRFETSGPANAAIIPRLAKVALSIRLVPNQEASVVAKNLTDYLHSQFAVFDSHNKLSVTIDRKAEPWLGDVNNMLFQTLEKAVMDIWGPFGGPPTRRNSLLPTSPTKAPSIFSPPRAGHYFSKKKKAPTPMTSDTLAAGSLTPNIEAEEAMGHHETSAVTAATGEEEPGASMDKIVQTTVTLPYRPVRPDSTPTMKSSSSSSNGNGNGSSSSSSSSSGTKGATAATAAASRRKKPLYIREGGSIPAIRFLEKEFDAPAAHLPCGQAGDNAHLDNERLRLENLYNSKSIFGRVFRDLPARC